MPLRVPLLSRSGSKRSSRSVGCVMGITDQLLYVGREMLGTVAIILDLVPRR